MLLSFSLNKPVACEQICQSIQKIINKFQQETGQIDNLMLVIDIKSVTDSADTLIPKLELKN